MVLASSSILIYNVKFTFFYLRQEHSSSRREGVCDLMADLWYLDLRRQYSLVVRALALRSGDPGFKTRSDHSLNLILVVPGSTSQLHL